MKLKQGPQGKQTTPSPIRKKKQERKQMEGQNCLVWKLWLNYSFLNKVYVTMEANVKKFNSEQESSQLRDDVITFLRKYGSSKAEVKALQEYSKSPSVTYNKRCTIRGCRKMTWNEHTHSIFIGPYTAGADGRKWGGVNKPLARVPSTKALATEKSVHNIPMLQIIE